MLQWIDKSGFAIAVKVFNRFSDFFEVQSISRFLLDMDSKLISAIVSEFNFNCG